jgi:arabinofuranosyltransferase
VYVVYIGGDFMAGRHWSSPFFLAVITMAFAAREAGLTAPVHLLGFAGAALGCEFGVEPLAMQRDTIQTREQGRFAIVRSMGIRDQRFNCSFYEALIGARGPASQHSWSQDGLRHKELAAKFLAANPDKRYVVVHGGAGKAPFHAGPDAVYIDPLAITDPLLARLPDADGQFWFSGHLERHVPDGYAHARSTGSLDRMDPALARYYAELRYVISGPLFDWERLVKIGRLHLGQYDEHKKAYLAGAYVEELARERERAEKKKNKQ